MVYFFTPKNLFAMRSKNNGSAEKQKTGALRKFFVDQLRDIYYVEKQMIRSLPEMREAATTEELQDALDEHLKQTERQVKRLEKVFELMEESSEGKRCEAMDGLVKETREIIAETPKGSMTRDAALIIAAQKVEHYEIGTYGGLVALALTMNMRRAAELLDKTLEEEERTDRNLTDIAERYINMEAEEEPSQPQEQQSETKKPGRRTKQIEVEEIETLPA